MNSKQIFVFAAAFLFAISPGNDRAHASSATRDRFPIRDASLNWMTHQLSLRSSWALVGIQRRRHLERRRMDLAGGFVKQEAILGSKSTDAWRRLSLQALLGTASTAVGLAVAVPSAIGLAQGENAKGTSVASVLLVGFVAPTLATSSIIYWIGKLHDGEAKGRFGATFAGTAAFSMVAIGLGRNTHNPFTALGLATLPAVGGMMGYALSRKTERSSVINRQGSGWYPGLPTLTAQVVTSPNGGKDMEYRLSVLNMTF
jgi:hypothetical protein